MLLVARARLKPSRSTEQINRIVLFSQSNHSFGLPAKCPPAYRIKSDTFFFFFFWTIVSICGDNSCYWYIFAPCLLHFPVFFFLPCRVASNLKQRESLFFLIVFANTLCFCTFPAHFAWNVALSATVKQDQEIVVGDYWIEKRLAVKRHTYKTILFVSDHVTSSSTRLRNPEKLWKTQKIKKQTAGA